MLSSLLDFWKRDADTAPNIFAWRTSPPRPAQTHPFPDDLPVPLREALSTRKISLLYSHQVTAWTHARAGRNLILATGTASGKTLAYNLPVLAKMLEDPQARALYLFPTKALAQDQLSVISDQLSVLRTLITDDWSPITDHWSLITGIYDGDTPQKDRPSIRRNARIVLSNPDMLHTGILPHHANWSDFFSNLKFVVIDEAHTYRGVFGSHVANVIRRLKRIADFYGSKPQFILASATIGNPKELAEALIEEPVALIDNDGSLRGERHFIIYNPPVTDAALGLRKSSLLESVRLTNHLLSHDVQSVVFARTRRSVEILLINLQSQISNSLISSSQIRGYRSGYLPHQRREIEQGLRDGSVKTVVATNALELGIDIGGLGAALMVGYPGTIASARQQAGRAGRGDSPAVSILVASPNPLDQFLAHHPEYFFERSPEMALVNPNHLLILLEHLRCAMFELPFQRGESFGSLSWGVIEEYLDFLLSNHEAHFSNEKYYWMQDAYPAANISLRSASPQSVVLQTVTEDGRPLTVGTVDGESASWMVHAGAIYMHEAQQYFVQELDLENRIAHLVPVGLDYYTEAQQQSEIQITSVNAQADLPSPAGRGGGGEGKAGGKGYGEIQVITQVVGFKKLRWFTNENLGLEPLDMPPSELQTTGYWLTLSEAALRNLRDAGVWSNDPNDYGPGWPQIRAAVRKRDQFKCQVCGAPETTREHDVHHKIPFRAFIQNGVVNREQANRLENLITLCQGCHRKVEQNVRIRSRTRRVGIRAGQSRAVVFDVRRGRPGNLFRACLGRGQRSTVHRPLRPRPGGDRLQPEIIRTAR
ncbi:MAG: DEAD/DEAH box helicase [Chloroflexi bacterium]|nr:DEAD/DEAH box helicase [Chloroflexota bacterium]